MAGWCEGTERRQQAWEEARGEGRRGLREATVWVGGVRRVFEVIRKKVELLNPYPSPSVQQCTQYVSVL